jgi:hypothetical protein
MTVTPERIAEIRNRRWAWSGDFKPWEMQAIADLLTALDAERARAERAEAALRAVADVKFGQTTEREAEYYRRGLVAGMEIAGKAPPPGDAG